MSPEISTGKNRFEEKFNIETTVVLKRGLPFPETFILNGENVNVKSLESATTQIRGEGKSKVLNHVYVVQTEKGKFELENDQVKNTWTLVGRLKELKK